MVVLPQSTIDHISLIKAYKPFTTAEIPLIDLSDPPELCGSNIVRACQDFGFFKVVNHGVPLDLTSRLEAEALRFFSLSQAEKDRHGPPDPFGYGSKRIGPNGDVGWVEYLLLHTNPDMLSSKVLSAFRACPQIFRSTVEEYVLAVKELACEVLELIADGLGLERRNMLSRMLTCDKSDSFFRMNHYPPSPPELRLVSGRNQLLGFGEHTDPQIISVLKSNSTSGLQICLRDGTTWVTVPPDHSSFFINIGDSLQVMTNGRFKSVKHRVVADPMRSRVSMIFFGGPPLTQKIEPIESLMEDGEESLYKEFTWSEYKMSAYKSRLADYRLGLFEKAAAGR